MKAFAAAVLFLQAAVAATVTASVAVCCAPRMERETTPVCCIGENHSCPLKQMQTGGDESGFSMVSCGLNERAAALIFGTRANIETVDVAMSVPQGDEQFESVNVRVLARFVAIDTPPPRA